MPSFLPLGLGSALTRLGTRVRRVMLSGVLLVPVAILAGPMERLIAAAACTTPGGSLMLTSAVRYVRALSAKADGVAPAAQGTQEGPWSVAGTADEMKHVVSVPSRDAEGKFLANAAEPIARVAATSIQTIPRGGERQQALTQRLLPGIPPELQIAYGLLVMLGLLGVPASRLWWRRLWPPEHAGDYAGHIGYWAARTLRGAVFALVFLPLTALVSAPYSLGRQVREAVTAPLGLWRRRASAPARPAVAQPQAAPAYSRTPDQAPAVAQSGATTDEAPSTEAMEPELDQDQPRFLTRR